MLQLALRNTHCSRLKPVSSAHLCRQRPIMTDSDAIEEETLPRYRPELYYPVAIGQTFRDRYKVLAKLGFGSESTIWLAKDTTKWRFQSNRFVALKVHTVNKEDDPSKFSEVRLSEVIARTDPKHEGLRYLRTALESFTIPGQSGHHLCQTYTPMRKNVATFQRRLSGGRIPLEILKLLLRYMLLGLDYLHTKCHIIHTDLKPDNILLGIEDNRIIHDLIQQEENSPSPAKTGSGGRIYPHRNFGDFKVPPGPPKLGDFGLAVQADQAVYYHPIQPDILQAPEVILCAGWSYSADIWNLGVMVWDLLEGRTLFHAQDPNTRSYAPEIHLAEMIAILGSPPQHLLQRGKHTDRFFTPQGDLIRKDLTSLPYHGFENTISVLAGEEKKALLQFVRRILTWLPEERATAAELLSDPWLRS